MTGILKHDELSFWSFESFEIRFGAEKVDNNVYQKKMSKVLDVLL